MRTPCLASALLLACVVPGFAGDDAPTAPALPPPPTTAGAPGNALDPPRAHLQVLAKQLEEVQEQMVDVRRAREQALKEGLSERAAALEDVLQQLRANAAGLQAARDRIAAEVLRAERHPAGADTAAEQERAMRAANEAKAKAEAENARLMEENALLAEQYAALHAGHEDMLEDATTRRRPTLREEIRALRGEVRELKALLLELIDRH